MSFSPLDVDLILENTLQNLEYKDLSSCCLVNSQWNRIAEKFLHSGSITINLRSESAILRYLHFVEKGGVPHGKLAVSNLNARYNPEVIINILTVLKSQVVVLKTAFNIGCKNGRHSLNWVLNNVPYLEELSLILFCGSKNDSIDFISTVTPAPLLCLRKLTLTINENVPRKENGGMTNKMGAFLQKLAIATPCLQIISHDPRPDWNYCGDNGLLWLLQSRLDSNPSTTTSTILSLQGLQPGLVHRWKNLKPLLLPSLSSLSLLVNGALGLGRIEAEYLLQFYSNFLKDLKLELAGSAVPIQPLRLPSIASLQRLTLHYDALPEKEHLLHVSLGEGQFPLLGKLEWILYQYQSLPNIIHSFRDCKFFFNVRELKIRSISRKNGNSNSDQLETIRNEHPNLFQALVNIMPCLS